jgi:cell division protein FtsL
MNRCLHWGLTVEMRDVTAVFTCGIVVVTCFYHVQNLRLNVEANQKKLDFDYDKFAYEQEVKKEESAAKSLAAQRLFAFNLCREFNTPVVNTNMHRARQFYLNDPLMQALKQINPADAAALKSWAKQFDLHPARKSVILMLNFFEQVAISIQCGFADDTICQQVLKTVVVQYYAAYRAYIEFRQHDAENGSATFLESFEALAIRWSNGKLKRK